MNVLRNQKQAVGTGIQQPVFVWSVPDRLSLATDLYTRRRCRCLPLHGVLRLCIFQTALKNTFFPWCYFRTLERARERHGFIRRVLFESLRVMHNDFSAFRTMIRQIEAICYRFATNGSFSTCISNLFFIFSLAKLSTPILSPRQKSLKCFVWFDDSIFSWRMIHWILRSYSVVLWLLT